MSDELDADTRAAVLGVIRQAAEHAGLPCDDALAEAGLLRFTELLRPYRRSRARGGLLFSTLEIFGVEPLFAVLDMPMPAQSGTAIEMISRILLGDDDNYEFSVSSEGVHRVLQLCPVSDDLPS
ncbi:MAG TPA: hypothetical protein VHQ86_00510 [Candidatus Saccharimonadia bacterium]|nr:hypothetical protein [Candidatus Saccharimonadia bacterium]